MEENYYAVDSFSPNIYVKLARAGFISISYKIDKKIYLVPEIQFEYSILNFKNLHISKKVSKLLKSKNFDFIETEDIRQVVNEINKYHHDSWICEEYFKMLNEISNLRFENFKLIAFELYEGNNDIIAGEIGYYIGKTYTSLSGFFNKEKKFNNYGKVQLVLLAKYLEKNGFDFWNLGHTSLKYKEDLGAKIYAREEFLKIWLISSQKVHNFIYI